ncbi:LysE family transporter [Deinococcus daejeonensis]|uniref:Uncharacterized protein n=1 Tax=Deinococcus daejeonensis TaxID=1007098 RepID=A0ABQ2JDG3_9DEIO|nr:LysE family transporter [Deinococcus daejeonensis]GGN43081.1 hypothetical protein GCM10010842_30200 [Deinococcus daejeonensis]
MPPLLRGLSLDLSLIVAIGPQNAFVLRHGLTRRFALLAALACALCDTLLITLGVLGCRRVTRRWCWPGRWWARRS